MKKVIAVFILMLILNIFVTNVFAKTRIYLRSAFTGGCSGCVDALDGDLPSPTKHSDPLNDGDKIIVITLENDSNNPKITAHYVLDADSGLAETPESPGVVPTVIIPDTNPGNKRWILSIVEKVKTIDGASGGTIPSDAKRIKGPECDATCASNNELTVTHSFSNGDLVYLDRDNYSITAVTGNPVQYQEFTVCEVTGTTKFKLDDPAGTPCVGAACSACASELSLTADDRIGGHFHLIGNELTGSIDPTASTSIVGVGTLFTTELVEGDKIFASSQIRTILDITDDTHLTVDLAFTDTANDTAPNRLPAILIIKDAQSNLDFIYAGDGRLYLGDRTKVFGAWQQEGQDFLGGVLTIGAEDQKGIGIEAHFNQKVGGNSAGMSIGVNGLGDSRPPNNYGFYTYNENFITGSTDAGAGISQIIGGRINVAQRGDGLLDTMTALVLQNEFYDQTGNTTIAEGYGIKYQLLNSSGGVARVNTLTQYRGFEIGSADNGNNTFNGTDWTLLYIQDLPDFGGTITNQTGIWIENIGNFSSPTLKYGLVLDGDGNGSGIFMGASQDYSFTSVAGSLTGTSTGGSGGEILEDTVFDFIANNLFVGIGITRDSDGESCIVTVITDADTVTCDLTNSAVWGSGEAYTVEGNIVRFNTGAYSIFTNKIKIVSPASGSTGIGFMREDNGSGAIQVGSASLNLLYETGQGFAIRSQDREDIGEISASGSVERFRVEDDRTTIIDILKITPRTSNPASCEVGDIMMDGDGTVGLCLCTVAGTPGTWSPLEYGGGGTVADCS